MNARKIITSTPTAKRFAAVEVNASISVVSVINAGKSTGCQGGATMTPERPCKRFNSTFRVKPNGSPLRSRHPMTRTRMKVNKPREGSVKDLERQLDDLTRRVVLTDETVCFTCRTPGTESDPLELSHLFTRTWRPTRWDVHPEGNCHAQHKSCNNRHEYRPETYEKTFIARLGQEAFDTVRQRADSGVKFEYTQLLAMILQRESMLK